MNVYAAASLFAILILLYWVIAEVFTVLFRLIGLPEEKARFQVVSMLTGAGFTTRESEMILSTRSRRRLGRITMLFGFVFNVTIVSAFVNIFVSMKMTAFGSKILSLLIPIAAVAAVLLLARYHKVRTWVDHYIERAADRYGNVQDYNGVTVIDQIGVRTIARVTLRTVPEAYLEKPLSEMDLKAVHGILVLMIEHAAGDAEEPTARTCFSPGDKLTVFGGYETICQVLKARERFTD